MTAYIVFVQAMAAFAHPGGLPMAGHAASLTAASPVTLALGSAAAA